jgi:hypothetical protein
MSHTKTDRIKNLVRKAQDRFPGQKLTACGKIKSGKIEDSVNKMDEVFIMWFNTPDGSTHIVKEILN